MPTPAGAMLGGNGAADGEVLPKRPVSPLPPNVPTGPKNPGNKYRDRDNNAQTMDGLDYGGGGGGRGGSVERERERESEEREKASRYELLIYQSERR